MLDTFDDIDDIITDVVIVNDDKFIKSIKLIYEKFTIDLMPVGECCSTSWIEEKDKFTNLINKKIKSIIENVGVVPDLPFSDIDSHDTNHLYNIRFKNSDDVFEFYLRNSSNGYYDGWLDIYQNIC